MAVGVGDVAPDFVLKDQHGVTWRLSDLRGRKAVLIVFYPWAFTGVCGGELTALEAALPSLAGDRVEVLAASTDSMYALRAYADRDGFTFPLLADFWPHGEVARSYGVLDEEIGIALRGSFLVDVDGVIRWSVVQRIPDARDVEDYRRAIAALG